MEMNDVLQKLPHHLMSLVIEQPYNNYTSRDHAVWRYVMRQNVHFLSSVAHGSYLDGLRKTGISINAIPHMYGMNRILKEIGWAAVAVDGFIPPSAFMEFQAYNVLVIAADIRPVNQIEYTPAPDIIHEAAGHAPIIANEEYSQYLKFFGEIGSKAFSSARDYELYEAVRHLSILKADPYTPKEEIIAAEKELSYIESTMGDPSEMSLIRNLHWWTVEYGLIGSPENPKIYGAGLLSSIGESYNCLKPHVRKIPYTIEAANYSFDITTQQPQLFVTPDFKQLSVVLNEFADTMALRKGGAYGLSKAQESKNTATVVLNSGLQISGTFTNNIIENETPVYLRTSGPTALSYNNKELYGHGKTWHKDGYGTPIGLVKEIDKPLHELTEIELEEAGIKTGQQCHISFRSGVNVSGHLVSIKRAKKQNLLFSFQNCIVTYRDITLFEPSWGIYDMAAGSEIISAFAGPADPDAFKLSYTAPSETTHKIQHTDQDKKLYTLYGTLRSQKESFESTTDENPDNVNSHCIKSLEELTKTWEVLRTDYPYEWLIMLEMLELLNQLVPASDKLVIQLQEQLNNICREKPETNKLITDGLRLLDPTLTIN